MLYEWFSTFAISRSLCTMIICDHRHFHHPYCEIISFQTKASWPNDSMWYYVSKTNPVGKQLILSKSFSPLMKY